jgi:hypothetical protein
LSAPKFKNFYLILFILTRRGSGFALKKSGVFPELSSEKELQLKIIDSLKARLAQ